MEKKKGRAYYAYKRKEGKELPRGIIFQTCVKKSFNDGFQRRKTHEVKEIERGGF